MQGIATSSKMDFKVENAVPSDSGRITDIFFSAFTNNLIQRIMPDTEDVRAFQTARFREAAESTETENGPFLVKVVGSENTGPVIAGFAMWKVYEGTATASDEGGKTEWPASSDSELCDSFFGGITRERKQAIGDQPHYGMSLFLNSRLTSRTGHACRRPGIRSSRSRRDSSEMGP